MADRGSYGSIFGRGQVKTQVKNKRRALIARRVRSMKQAAKRQDMKFGTRIDGSAFEAMGHSPADGGSYVRGSKKARPILEHAGNPDYEIQQLPDGLLADD